MRKLWLVRRCMVVLKSIEANMAVHDHTQNSLSRNSRSWHVDNSNGLTVAGEAP